MYLIQCQSLLYPVQEPSTNLPVAQADETAPADNVPECRRYHRLPDVVSDTEWCAIVHANRHQEHVGDNVVHSKHNEDEDRPPDRNNLADDLTSEYALVHSQTYQPVRYDA